MSDALLFLALARAAEQHLSEFKAQHLVNTVWACVMASVVDELLFLLLPGAVQ